jgi:hypothetical protein
LRRLLGPRCWSREKLLRCWESLCAIGKFALVLGKSRPQVKLAGGGVSDLLNRGSSKLAVARCRSVIYGAYKLYDYASGAKAIREALEGHEQNSERWKNNPADTFYSRAG